MIFASHMAAGAVIGAKTNSRLATFLISAAFHFILDIVPHQEYDIEALKQKIINKKWLISLVKVAIDFFVGLSIGLYFGSKYGNLGNVFLGMFSSLIPDLLLFISFYWNPDWINAMTKFHQWIHFYKYKKIPFWIRFATQVAVIMISILILI